MSTKHSPGPWNCAGPSDIGRDTYSIYGNGPLAYTAGPSDYGDAAEANARLIAAAPALIECLIALLDEESEKGGEAGDWDWTRFSEADPTGNWHAAKQAIDKATKEVN